MKKFILLLALLIPVSAVFADIAIPVTKDGSTYNLENSHYKIGYSDRFGQAAWCFYKLNSAMITNVPISQDDFKADSRVKNNRITPKEMTSASLEKVQLFPLTHAGADPTVQKSSYLATNVVLMGRQLHESTWTRISREIEAIAREKGSVYVISGPVFDLEMSKIKYIINNKMAVPSAFYRIVLYYESGNMICKCWKFPNRIPSDYERNCDLDNYKYNLYQLEAETGVDFFDNSIDTFFKKEKMEYLENHVK